MDAQGRTFDALGVRDGRIVAVGTKEAVSASMRPGFAQTDLRGRTVLPGFYAAHDHFPDAGLDELYQVDLNSPPIGTIRNMDELVAALRRKADATPPGEWVVGWGYDDTLLAEVRHPTRADLDRVSTRHPVWIVHVSGHLAVANSRALEIAGVTKDTQQPRGGRIRLDAQTGEPNGVFEEAGSLVGIHIPGYTPEQRQAGIVKAQSSYLASGVTTTVIAGASPETLHDLDDAVASGALRLRISALLAARTADRPPDLRAPPERIHLTGVKLRQDGSLQGYTGYLSAPYFKQPEGKDDYRGYPARLPYALAQKLAEDSTQMYRQLYGRPVEYVAGTFPLPYTLSFYAPEHPHGLHGFDLHRSTWIDPSKLKAGNKLVLCGTFVFERRDDPGCPTKATELFGPPDRTAKLVYEVYNPATAERGLQRYDLLMWRPPGLD